MKLAIRNLYIVIIVVRFGNTDWLRKPVILGCHNAALIFTFHAALCTFTVMAGQNGIYAVLFIGILKARCAAIDPAGQPACQPANESASQPASQSVSQPASKSVSHSLTLTLTHSIT